MNVCLDQFCETENGAVRSVNLSRLYALFPRAEQPDDRLWCSTMQLVPDDPVMRLEKLFELAPAESTALVRQESSAVSRFFQPTIPELKLEPLTPRPYSVKTRSEDRSDNGRIEIELPFGMPRYVNARTLKEMLGVSPSDPLLRKVGDRWMVCPDSFRIDVTDLNEVFEVGKIQVLS